MVARKYTGHSKLASYPDGSDIQKGPLLTSLLLLPYSSTAPAFVKPLPVRLLNDSPHPVPAYQTALAAGMDVRAWLPDGSVTLGPLERELIGTGLRVELPAGYELQVRPRSGLAFKQGLTVLNSPGTVDADYRGEIKVLLVNLSNEDAVIHDGDRIAQLIVARHETVTWEAATALSETARGAGGYGSTGK